MVFARRQIQSAWVPFVVHIFPPLITYSSPSLTAFVLIPEFICGRVVYMDGGREKIGKMSLRTEG